MGHSGCRNWPIIRKLKEAISSSTPPPFLGLLFGRESGGHLLFARCFSRVCIYRYISLCVCMCVHIYIYMYTDVSIARVP